MLVKTKKIITNNTVRGDTLPLDLRPPGELAPVPPTTTTFPPPDDPPKPQQVKETSLCHRLELRPSSCRWLRHTNAEGFNDERGRLFRRSRRRRRGSGRP